MDKSSYDISLEIDKKEKSLSELLKTNQVVEEEKLNLQKKILDMQSSKKDLEISLSKSSHNIKQINIELKLLKSKFWGAKNSGL